MGDSSYPHPMRKNYPTIHSPNPPRQFRRAPASLYQPTSQSPSFHQPRHTLQITLLRRQHPPAIPSFPPPSRRTPQIQPFPQSDAGVSLGLTLITAAILPRISQAQASQFNPTHTVHSAFSAITPHQMFPTLPICITIERPYRPLSCFLCIGSNLVTVSMANLASFRLASSTPCTI